MLANGFACSYYMGIPIMERPMKSPRITFQELVGHFGTQLKTAESLGVDQATVSGWVRGKHGMSPAVALRAEKLTKKAFTRYQLCPSVFEAPSQNEVAS